MFTLNAIAVMIGGSLDEGLALIFKELGEIRSQFPDAADQIDNLANWLGEKTAGQWTPEALLAIAAQIVGLFSGKGWGPPNPGSVAGM